MEPLNSRHEIRKLLMKGIYAHAINIKAKARVHVERT